MQLMPPSESDEFDTFGHMPGDEMRANIIGHYVQKFHAHGLHACSLKEAKAWVSGIGGAATRREKVEIWSRIAGHNR